MLRKIIERFRGREAKEIDTFESSENAPKATESKLGGLRLMFASSIFPELDSRLITRAERLVNTEVKPSTPFRFYSLLDPVEALASLGIEMPAPYLIALAATPDDGVAAVAVMQLLRRVDAEVPKQMELNFIAVHPSWKSLGLGGAILDNSIEAMANQYGIGFVYGSCSESSAGFYRAQGFSVTEPGGRIPAGFVPEHERSSSDPGFERMFWRSLVNN